MASSDRPSREVLLKSLLFWFVLLVVAVAVYWIAQGQTAH
jgi:hypothetical protein